jgi:hypothetical protein
MWRELIDTYTNAATFSAPAIYSEVALAGESLVSHFPPTLEAILREANGIDGEYGLGLLWPIQRIVAENETFRSNPDFRDLYMPFNCLLFFADAGNGDQFAFAVLNGESHREDIFVWNHEDDSRTGTENILRVVAYRENRNMKSFGQSS